jgi:putative membrane protein insertion efficiency factor
MFAGFLIHLLRSYRMFLSLDHGLVGKRLQGLRICRYQPSCSAYMIEAIERFGVLYGVYLGLCRIGRCTPWGSFGWDPVPKRPVAES